MSLLNLHQELLDVLSRCELVYSPLMDVKEYPHRVDIVLVEGAVANEENREMAGLVRQRTRFVISLGDCAVNGNVAALRNPFDLEAVERCCYAVPPALESASQLLPRVLPLHQVIRVNAFIPGCPPESELIRRAIFEQIEWMKGKKAPDSLQKV
jgi:NAD-reducing hydrogenase small subunit